MSWFDAARRRYLVDADPERTERRLELVFLVLLFILLLQILWWLLSGLRPANVDVVEPAEDSLKVADASVSGLISASESRALQARPLFWASRRPPVELVEPLPDTSDSQQPPSPAIEPRLEGLLVTGALGAGDEGQAIVLYKDKLMRLGIGDSVEGWTLESVSLGQIVLVSVGSRDVRRITHLPIVAAQQSSGSGAQSPYATPRGAEQASNTTDAAQDGDGKMQENNKAKASLSLGG